MRPAKSRYADRDAARWAKHYGVAYSPNRALLDSMRTGAFDGTLLSAAGLAAQELGVSDRVNDALFESVWAGADALVSEEGRRAFLKTRHIAADDLWRLAADPGIGAAGAKALAEIMDVAQETGRRVITGDYRRAAASFVDYWSGEGPGTLCARCSNKC